MSDLGEVPDRAEGVTVKVDNESLNDLLTSKPNTQLIGTDLLPQKFPSRSHLAAQFFGALKFFFGDFLICDDVLDWHGGILR